MGRSVVFTGGGGGQTDSAAFAARTLRPTMGSDPPTASRCSPVGPGLFPQTVAVRSERWLRGSSAMAPS